MNLKIDSQKIRIEVNLPVSPEKAWEYLTQSDHIANWWGNHVVLEARPGGTFLEKWFDGEKQVITSGRVAYFDPPSALKITWADDDWPGETNVTFSLPGGDNGTRLILEHSGWEVHAEEERIALMDAHADGWTHYLQKLATYAEEFKTMVSDKLNHIGVYKTDVEDRTTAKSILDAIQRQFRDYDVSFDLEDCDKVFRVESMNGPVDEAALVLLFERFGHNIEQLP